MQDNGPDQSKAEKKTIFVLVICGLVCLLTILALVGLPYFATRPLSRDQLSHPNHR
jgi:hypothetical protein